VQKMLSLISDMPGSYPRPHVSDAAEIVGSVAYNQEQFLMIVEGVGFYIGVEDVAEYNYLSQADLNANAYNIDKTVSL
jgi:hypothetical protein